MRGPRPGPLDEWSEVEIVIAAGAAPVKVKHLPARPEGFKAPIRYILKTPIADAVRAIIARLHATSPDKKQPPNYRERDQRIRELYASGMTQAAIGAMFGISGRRVSYIVHGIKTRK